MSTAGHVVLLVSGLSVAGCVMSSGADRSDLLDQVQTLFPVQGAGIGSALQAFFASANALAASPQEIAVRSQLLGSSEELAGQIRGSAQSLRPRRYCASSPEVG